MQPTTDQPAIINLAPILDLTAAAPLKAEFEAARGRPVRLDASAVDRIGALCLQVILSARLTWDHDAMRLSLGETSPAFEQGLMTLGASPLLSSIPRD